MLWRPDDPTGETVSMSNWAVFKVALPGLDESTYHAAGTVGGAGRVCSPIQNWDPIARIITTRSGKQYNLVVGPVMSYSSSGDVSYTFERWLKINKVTEYEDVSSEFLVDTNEHL